MPNSIDNVRPSAEGVGRPTGLSASGYYLNTSGQLAVHRAQASGVVHVILDVNGYVQ